MNLLGEPVNESDLQAPQELSVALSPIERINNILQEEVGTGNELAASLSNIILKNAGELSSDQSEAILRLPLVDFDTAQMGDNKEREELERIFQSLGLRTTANIGTVGDMLTSVQNKHMIQSREEYDFSEQVEYPGTSDSERRFLVPLFEADQPQAYAALDLRIPTAAFSGQLAESSISVNFLVPAGE